MFAKVINNAVEVYPYNPQVDHPLTSFPVGASYPSFNCYWVHPTTPVNPDPALYDAVEGSPVFNGTQWEQSWTFVEKPPAPPAVNWDGFNAYMLTDATFKSYRNAVRLIDGDLNSALFNSYSLVATNGVGAFSLVWGAWVQASAITTPHREAIAVVAEGSNLPADFVTVIRGS